MAGGIFVVLHCTGQGAGRRRAKQAHIQQLLCGWKPLISEKSEHSSPAFNAISDFSMFVSVCCAILPPLIFTMLFHF